MGQALANEYAKDMLRRTDGIPLEVVIADLERHALGNLPINPAKVLRLLEAYRESAPPPGARSLHGLHWGPNDKREPGRVHTEWHFDCGCALHPEPSPHVHPCPDPAHRAEAGDTALRDLERRITDRRKELEAIYRDSNTGVAMRDHASGAFTELAKVLDWIRGNA